MSLSHRHFSRTAARRPPLDPSLRFFPSLQKLQFAASFPPCGTAACWPPFHPAAAAATLVWPHVVNQPGEGARGVGLTWCLVTRQL
jgi:hypothetical protein